MIGNAGAALHGAPVTTVDIDFLIRDTAANRKKINGIASELGAVVYRPFFPVSKVMRLMNDDESLQVDFMDEVSGIRSFEGIRKRSENISVAGERVRVAAALADIIKMKRAANRPRDRAVLEDLEITLEKSKANETPTARAAQRTK